MAGDRTPLAAGQVIEVAIEKGVYRGRGLGRHEGRVVFVPRAHSGDRVRARVVEAHADWAEARLVEVLASGPGRRPAPCPFAVSCGGCAYQELSYERQLATKQAVLIETLARAGVRLPAEVSLTGSPESGWRLRASLHFSTVRGALRLGLREEGTRRVVDVSACQQLSPAMNLAARGLRDALLARPGVLRSLRGLDLFEAPEGGGLVAVLQTVLAPAAAQGLAVLGRQVPGLSGFGVACGGRLVWLYGSPHVEANVLGAKLRGHVRGFFQANRFLLEPLAAAVVEAATGESGAVLDLYAGVGLFAVPLAARGQDVTAVEWGAEAVRDARANARRAGLALRVVEADVGQALAQLPPEPGERIILDPPRTGAGADVVERIAARRPSRIVYVSCDPATLARDLAAFAKGGYDVGSVSLFDMFPTTFHLETVVCLHPS